MTDVLLEANLPAPRYRGKVRDTYDLGDRLLIVATDRISAFDVVMARGVPDKGAVLTQLSAFWFEKIRSEEHTSELQSRQYLVCRLLLEKKNNDLAPPTPLI